MANRRIILLITVIVLSGLLYSSCGKKNLDSLEMEQLFTLSYGRMEDQIDLIQREGLLMKDSVNISMRNGLFYIADGASNKIAEYTSYGDILSLIYNPDENPEPFLVIPRESENIQATKKAFPFYFREIRGIAVSPHKDIIVIDRVPRNREEYDASLGVVLNRVLLKFSKDGEFEGFIGQEGMGGTPFPVIVRADITEQGEIAVLSRSPKVWFFHLFTGDGRIKYIHEFPVDSLPISDSNGVVPSLDTAIVDMNGSILYLKIDYYRTPKEASVRVKSSVDFYKSSVLSFSLETGKYLHSMDIPRNVIVRESAIAFEEQRQEVLYDFIGSSNRGHLFFLSPLGRDSHELLIMKEDGKVHARVMINLKDSEILYRTFAVTGDGILYGLIGMEDKAKIVWWRSDKILERKRK